MISIVIPVHNAAPWLRDCLDSVLGQTLREIEVICVDDGSTDESAAILEEYVRADCRLRIIHQENQGAGVARNAALDVVEGEAVVFMDPDDYYPDNGTLALLRMKLSEGGCKVAGGRLRCVPADSARARRIQASWDDYGRFPTPGFHRYSDWQAPWGYTCYIYDAKLIKESGARFGTARRFQDPPFFVKVMAAAGSFFSFDDCVYCYRIRDEPVDWDANGGRLASERMKGYVETHKLALEYGYPRLAYLLEQWMGVARPSLCTQLLINLLEMPVRPMLAPSELEIHDFFDACRAKSHMDDSLFCMLRRILSAPSGMRVYYLSIVAERVLLAKQSRRLGLRRFSAKRIVLLLWLLLKGMRDRHPHPVSEIANKVLCVLRRNHRLSVLVEPLSLAALSERPVTVVVPVYNGFDALQRLCRTLFKHTSGIHRIVFVDDKSPDARILPYLRSIEQEQANVRIVASERNMGFSGAVNRGAELAEGDFVVLNTDTEVPDGWIPRLFAPIWADPEVASAMPLTNEWAGNVASNPGVISLEELERIGVDVVDRIVSRIVPDDSIWEVRNTLGFCMAISAAAWRKVGPFAGDIFGIGYGEETDWCGRARYRFGLKCVLAQNVLVAHWHGGSFPSEIRRIQMDRNRERIRSRSPQIFAADDSRFAVNIRAVVETAHRLKEDISCGK